ncbi:unnamed protein product [Leptidea sinapis]|uniref:PDZ domain-containing protein n=1 Tax=Leptidea sinapis TaxID=189913 RepID=A0A5E4QDF6_9NEOP|nr:unnamed protein product [Leptidea sinapis]
MNFNSVKCNSNVSVKVASDGRLRSGDMLLRIGAVSVVGMCARQAAAVLRQCGACVRLLVARPAHSNTQSLGASPAPIVPSRLLADPIELERSLAEAGHDGFGALSEDNTPPSPTPVIEETFHHRKSPPPERLPLDMAVRGSGEPETLKYEVHLNKDSSLGLGITVAGYVCEQEELSGIFVKSISAGSSADVCGKIQVNDRIIEVDGTSLHGVTNHRAVALLRDAKGPIVRLKALRYLRGAGFERLQKALAAQDGKRSPIAPPSPSVTSLAKYSFSVVGSIIKEKDSGLGISLEGTVRVVGGKEVQARHYIRAIAPDGPVARMGLYQVGDELLEVNGWRVLGAHHVDVVTRLRGVTSPVLLVVVRKRSEQSYGIEHNLAKSGILGGSLQDLLSPPQRLIKAKSESSVTSLCSANTVLSTGQEHSEFCSDDLERNRSRSLEPLSWLAMWSDTIDYIQLQKEDRGLGFSILDYLDPSEPSSSVIVVRSVVSGGAAATDGRLAPGDRLMSVNGVDISRASLATAVAAIKSAPKGIVTIGVAKPLPCSTVVGGEKANGPTFDNSQDCINSLASDDHTGMDSFHECLQEYGEGLEVVQICLEPEESSIKDDELSALADMSNDDFQKKDSYISDDEVMFSIDNKDNIKINGVIDLKLSKSVESLDDQDDDMTITEDDAITAPRELHLRSKSEERKINGNTSLSKQHSKDLSTSDEMVFAVTPTGLERISYEQYWKECDENKEKVTNNVNCKECSNSLISEDGNYNVIPNISVHEEKNILLYIDHEIDGYETCLDDESPYIKLTENKSHKINGKREIKELNKHNKIGISNKDSEVCAKDINDQITFNTACEVPSNGHPYIEERIIKQMQSLRIEPINVNVAPKVHKKRSPTKQSKKERHCIEYYNDQDECLKEIRRKKLEEDKRGSKGDRKKNLDNKGAMERKLQFKKKELSEESTDLESYVPGCHKCFLENYAYIILI